MATIAKGGVPLTPTDKANFRAAMEVLGFADATDVTATKALPVAEDKLFMLDSENGGVPVLVTKAELLAEVALTLSAMQSAIDDLTTALAGKQDTLVSGDTLKTINTVSLLGAGDITISGGTTTSTPDAFLAGDWTATPGDGQIAFNIINLPADGGDALTALEYTLTGSTWTAFAGTGTGIRTVTGLTNDTAYPTQVRAVNSIGPGGASDIKSRTPVVASAAPVISDSSRAGPSTFGTTLPIAPPAGMVAGDHLVVVVFGSSAFSSMSAGTWFDRTPAAWSTSGRRLLVSDSFGSVPGTLTATFGASSLHEASVFSISNIDAGALLGSGEGTTGSAAGARDHNYTTTAANSVAVGFIDFVGGAVTGVGTPDVVHEWDLNPSGGYLNGFAVVRAAAGSYAASLAPVGDSSPSEYGWAEIGAV